MPIQAVKLIHDHNVEQKRPAVLGLFNHTSEIALLNLPNFNEICSQFTIL